MKPTGFEPREQEEGKPSFSVDQILDDYWADVEAREAESLRLWSGRALDHWEDEESAPEDGYGDGEDDTDEEGVRIYQPRRDRAREQERLAA